MTIGFLYGILAALFWSLTNVIDKFLTRRHASDGDVWGILILSSLFPAVLLPISLHFSSNFITKGSDIAILMSSGALMVIWIYFYLKALTEDDTSVVMTLLVLAPFFSLLFSAVILGEMLSGLQLSAGGLLVLGALTVTHTTEGGFKKNLFFYAITASIVMGLMHTLFKFIAYQEEFWSGIFWRSSGMVLVGLILCLIFTSIRDKFYNFLTNHLKTGLTVNTTNESLTLIGDLFFGFAILLAPIALVQTTEAYQPIFILIISYILTRLGFESVSEDYSKLALVRKCIGICLVLSGSVLLVFNS